MATVKHRLGPRDALYPASAYPQYKSVSGSNFPVESLAFDPDAAESVYFAFPAVNYGSGNVTARIRWYADTAASGKVSWGASLAAITPDVDTQDIETKAFGAEAVANDDHLGTTNQRLHECTATITGLDSVAAEDWCVLKLRRIATDGTNDTMTGDALVVEIGIEYSDT